MHYTAWIFIAIVAVAVLMWPALGGAFLLDDLQAVVNNETLRVADSSFTGWWRAASSLPWGIRSLSMLTFAVNMTLGDGTSARSLLAVNLALHCANTALVGVLAFRLARFSSIESAHSRLAIAVAATFAWACHPLQVSTVFYAVQRMEMLATTFILLALLVYVDARSRQLSGRAGGWRLIGAAVLAVSGVLAKEISLEFFAYALALELGIFHFLAANRRAQLCLRWGYAAICVIGVLIVAVAAPAILHSDLFPPRDFTPPQRMLTQLRVLPLYLGQIVWPAPSRLTFYYDTLVPSTGWLAPLTTLFGAVLIGALLVGAFAIRRTAPMALLGLLWFLAGHGMTSSYLPLEMAFEHRNYLPLFGILLGLSELLGLAAERLQGRAWAPLLLVPLLALSFTTFLRASLWGQPLALQASWHRDSPKSAQAAFGYAKALLVAASGNPRSPYFVPAVAAYEQAASLPNASPLAESVLIMLYSEQGLPVNPRWWASMEYKLRVRAFGPEEQIAIGNLQGLVESRPSVQAVEVARLWRAVLQRNPTNAWAHMAYSQLLHRPLEDEASSIQHLQSALELQGDIDPYKSQYEAMLELHRADAAAAILRMPAMRGLVPVQPVPGRAGE